jgi:integrase
VLVATARQLRARAIPDEVNAFMEMLAETDDAGIPVIARAAEQVASGLAPPRLAAQRDVTMSGLAAMWTSGDLHRRYPDHVAQKASALDDQERFTKHIAPIIGDRAVASVQLADCERVMSSIPAGRRPGLRRHVAQVLHRMLNLAVYPLGLIAANPIPRGWLPRVRDDLAKEALFPDEDAALMRAPNAEVPLLRRLFYGFLAREGGRLSETARARWRDVDLAHGYVSLDRNKTHTPLGWAMAPGTERALRAWRERFRPDATDDDYIFAEHGVPISTSHAADQIRADLRAAGVTRAALFHRSESRLPFRAHDLRATFVTIHLAAGMGETWIKDRTGHKSNEMLERYRRRSRAFAEQKMVALTPLDEAIPELATPPPGTRLGKGRRKRGAR